MYYELYIDILFFVNFMMDAILLLLLKKLLKCSVKNGRVFLGALIGAVALCLVTVVPIPWPWVKFLLFHLVINTLMVKIGLGLLWNRNLLRAVILLYISSFLLGGILEYLRQYVEAGSLFFALAVASYYIASGVFWFLSMILKTNRYRCQVELCQDGRSCKVPAIIDTGNRLLDNVTGKPVSIVDRQVAETLFAGKMPEKIRYIPYHSIGKKEGVLPVMTVDKFRISEEGESWVERPLIGISGESISSDGEYRMILHPDV